jgi:hypothetical protein
MSTVTITLNLDPGVAAGLKRFAEKVSFEQAASVLYPHVHADIRANQTHAILIGLAKLNEALADAEVRSWPWVDSGQP